MQSATYSPEDNKLRLYVGRVPRDEYEKLRADGWTSTPKQSCDFVAVWTPTRRDTALEYAGIIEDEDQGPEDRAADRAERFGEYRDKRTSEAVGHADRYDQGPQAHGYQSAARAERAAGRHDRIASHACDSWSKAEYWQRRTAGVINHALYKSRPDVRMGRIKTIEAELRKERAEIEKRTNRFKCWQDVAACTDPEKQTKLANIIAGSDYCWSKYPHPVTGREESLYSLLDHSEHPITGAQAAALFFSNHSEPAQENNWTQHLSLRLAYENQMLEAQGGRAAFVEMVPGGYIGGYQIRKVNKSSATGRVVSVNVIDPKGFSGFTRESGYKEHVTRPAVVTLNIERLDVDAYRPPTAEDLAKLETTLKAEKAKAPTKAPCPLINPADADAERLQEIWNDRAKSEHEAGNTYTSPAAREMHSKQFKPSTVCRISQAVYSANSKGDHARAETKNIYGNATQEPRQRFYDYEKQAAEWKAIGPKVCQVRITSGDGSDYGAKRVIILTDKPQKPFPAAVWEKYTPKPTTATQPDLITA